MKDNERNIQERRIVSQYQAVQKKLDQANETLKPFTKEQIREAFEKARSQKRDKAHL